MKLTHVLIAGMTLAIVTAGVASYADFGGKELKGNSENREAVQAAMESGDYSALPEQAQERISEEDFIQKIERRAEMEAHRTEVESVVADGDFEAFQELREAHRAEREANRPDDAPERPDRPEPTEEEMQERFDRMVEYYGENGELPQKKHRGKRGMGRMMRK